MADRKRSGGRAGNARRTSSLVPSQMPWKQPINNDKPTEPLSLDGIHSIHNGCIRILKESGLPIILADTLKDAAEGHSWMQLYIFQDEDFVMELLESAPAKFSVTPRNKDHKIIIGGNMSRGDVRPPFPSLSQCRVCNPISITLCRDKTYPIFCSMNEEGTAPLCSQPSTQCSMYDISWRKINFIR